MQEEIKALAKNKTWDVVQLPQNKKPVGCRWIYKIKYNSNGSIERYKARLVAKGYTQTYGIDYKETFALVAKMNTIRVLLSVVVNLDWKLYQMDVKNIFLQGTLEDEVYMNLPPGHPKENDKNLACKLNKSIYGLKQSLREWYAKLRSALVSFKFKVSNSDHSMFFKHNTQSTIIVLIYVDDIIITGNDTNEIYNVKKFLQRKFDIKDLRKLKYFLDIEIAYSNKGLFLSQRKCVLDLLQETGKSGCKPINTPSEPNLKLGPNDGDPLTDVSQFQRLVGKLIYFTVTRPDITFAVNVVRQFMHAPRTTHMNAVVRILKYLKGSPGRGVRMQKNRHVRITAYSDADWAGSSDRRTTTGYCTFVGGNLVTWRSKKQSVVARSSAEAEYRAMASTTIEAIWLKQLMQDIGVKCDYPIPMFCDSQAARHIVNNPVFHERTKHIEIDYHFIREKITSKEIETPYILSQNQLADIFTKSLIRSQCQNLLFKLGSFDIYEPNLRGSVEENN
jgi:Reverse transcriptase (RNA-dependent DNA polymerase)